eukprot:13650249-Alexandrium_andersonii.AAC.1
MGLDLGHAQGQGVIRLCGRSRTSSPFLALGALCLNCPLRNWQELKLGQSKGQRWRQSPTAARI